MWFKQLFKINSNVIFLLVVFLCLLVTGTAAALDGNEILLQVDRNLQPESYEMYRKLINIEPDGSKKEYVLYTVKKGQDRMVALFLSPASEKGRSTLRLGDNMWLYIPIPTYCVLITAQNMMLSFLKKQRINMFSTAKLKHHQSPMTA
jgi:hypothetical protein